MSADQQSVPAPSSARGRALVLGGGGIAGIAWESGLLMGLAAAGVELDVDLMVGTSAGSAVAALLRAGLLTPEGLTAAGLGAGASAEPDPSSSPEAAAFDGLRFATIMAQAGAGAADAQQARARLGEWARSVEISLPQDAWEAQMASRLPQQWPVGRLAITAVDAVDGTFRVLDADSGVPLARAVAASCTVPSVYPLVTIDGHPHMDGGMRSATNADVAAGYDAVLVVSCGPEAPASPYGPTLTQALDELRRDGEVLLVSADDASLRAFGTNVLDPATQGPAFAAGWAQGQRVAPEVSVLWR